MKIWWQIKIWKLLLLHNFLYSCLISSNIYYFIFIISVIFTIELDPLSFFTLIEIIISNYIPILINFLWYFLNLSLFRITQRKIISWNIWSLRWIFRFFLKNWFYGNLTNLWFRSRNYFNLLRSNYWPLHRTQILIYCKDLNCLCTIALPFFKTNTIRAYSLWNCKGFHLFLD